MVHATDSNPTQTLDQDKGKANLSTKTTLPEATSATVTAVREAIESAPRAIDGTPSGSRTAAEGHQNALEPFEIISRRIGQASQQTVSSVQHLAASPGVTGRQLWELQEGLMSLTARAMQANISAAQELFCATDPSTAFEVQQRYLRGCIAMLAQGANLFIGATHRIADQTIRSIGRETGQSATPEGTRSVVADVMNARVRVATPDDTVQQATHLMRDENTDVLAVGDGDRLIGVVTEHDLATRLLAEGKDPAKTKVREVMSQEAKFVFDDQGLDDAAREMVEHRARRLPVVSRDKRIVGLVSAGDLGRPNGSGKAAA